MGHQHSGNYSSKHISGISVAKPILSAVKARSEKGKISCEDAHLIAQEMGISPQQVGVAIDLSEIRITGCQLGLFNSDANPDTARSPAEVPVDLQQTIKTASAKGKISCLRAWQIADTHNLSRSTIGKSCEISGIKISKCQLGAF